MNALALTYEDDRARRFRLFQQMDQQSGLVLDVIGTVIPLVNFLRSRVEGVAETSTGSSSRRSAKSLMASPSRVAENSIVCLRQRVSPAMCSISLREAHIQHAVRFIKDQGFQRRGNQIFFFNILQQAAVVATTISSVLAEHFSMVHIGDTAGNGGDIQMSMFCQLTRAWSATRIASSRVGVRIRMRGGPDFLRGKSSRCCNAGRRYAAVLPVPVGLNREYHGHQAQAE